MAHHTHPTALPSIQKLLAILMITTFLLSACGAKTANLQAVPTATAVPPTETAGPPTATDTPEPTATETPVPTNTPTPDLTATAAVEATKTAEAVLEKIKPELEKVGVKPEDGQLVWHSDEDIVLSASNYNETEYQKLDDAGSLGDFVMHADIQWNSSSGLAGCGFIYRAEDDLKQGAFYELFLVRLQSAPAWLMSYIKFGRVQVEMNREDQFSNYILDKPDSVNKVTLVARGQNLQTYINGEKMRLLESNKQLEGIAAFEVNQESGKTTCTFKNGWVYSLKK